MEELEKLILYIQHQYKKVNKRWMNDDNYIDLNMKKTRVIEFYKNEKLMTYAYNYRNFVDKTMFNFMDTINNMGFKNEITSRVKHINSIQYKIENYVKNHVNGKGPVKKCLNDIFGIRMIFKNKINYEEIIDYIKKRFPELKCIESIRGRYHAIHVYFGNDSNKNFQWELQLWDISQEEINLISHAEYKQGYTEWEHKNEGGR